jgi:hypothetical protein
LTTSDRADAVFDDGRIQQLAAPDELPKPRSYRGAIYYETTQWMVSFSNGSTYCRLDGDIIDAKSQLT